MKKRILSIDSLRFIAVFSVILLHYFPAAGLLKTVVDQLARFAVPFFFITSGYFLGLKLTKQDSKEVYVSYILKILKLYLFWSLLYFLNPDIKGIQQFGILSSYFNKFHIFAYSGWENILFVGISFHFFEMWILRKYFGTNTLLSADFGFSTVFMGLGVFLIGLNNTTWLNNKFMADLGLLSFGIYACHVMLFYRISFILTHFQFLQLFLVLVYPLLVLSFSVVFIIFFRRVPFLKNFI